MEIKINGNIGDSNLDIKVNGIPDDSLPLVADRLIEASTKFMSNTLDIDKEDATKKTLIIATMLLVRNNISETEIRRLVNLGYTMFEQGMKE